MNSGDRKLCLNMIVKNEMANLRRCLLSVAEHVDCWVIGDTGSTDGTQDFVRSFFAERGLPGELHSFPFVNFEQARNEALRHAYASDLAYDYLLLTDADMELVVEDRDFRVGLTAPGYRLLQRAGSGFKYWNVRMLRRDAGAWYRGVTHEYTDVPGGTEALDRVWYKDHATGANRVDKFERDIRLLTDALANDPENVRYAFYLAQSYQDAGRKREAVAAYGKRITMGGWAEEAWIARLQRARNLRDLGEEGEFVREAIAAYHERPARAEPLYDLARYYRIKGQHEISALFSEWGLDIVSPVEDMLFVEDYVYTHALREEFSIAANYARDPRRKDRGRAICNALALERSIPAATRDLARWNLHYYLEPLRVMLPSCAAREVDFAPAPGFRLSRLSVAESNGKLLAIARAVPDDLGPDDAGRDFLLTLNAALDVVSADEIAGPSTAAKGPVLEDAVLFAWRGAPWCLASVGEAAAGAPRERILARVDATTGRLTERRVVAAADARMRERRWMPRVEGDTLLFVQAGDPVLVADDRGRAVAETSPAMAADAFRGSTPMVAFEEGWLAVVHEARVEAGTRSRQHRFALFDARDRLRRVSRRFFLQAREGETMTGLAWHPHGGRLLISYTIGDRGVGIASVDAAEVARLLPDAYPLPLAPDDRAGSGSAEVGKTRPKLGTRLLPARVEIDPAYAADSDAQQHDAANDRTPDRVRLLPTDVDIDPAFPLPPSRNTAGASPHDHWVPPKPSAGTELMVDALRARLGSDLDGIDLQINRYDPARFDPRPIVVWFHHDCNQDYVQWCRDKALVDRVALCVFVSDWQRLRYIREFGLRPERCVVLRNATAVSREVRPWTPGPIWRCAYTSTPFRGLSVLLKAWETLKPANAELHVWSSMKLYRMDEHDKTYAHLYEQAMSLPGVTYHGLWPNDELRRALRDFHFLTYPCMFEETSCLAVIEALAAGCRVIAPAMGALPETTAGYARLYPWHADPDRHAAAFARALQGEIEEPWNGDPDLAETAQRHCLAVYDWPRLEFEWRRLIASVVKDGRG